MREPCRIGVFGHYGNKNLGDEAIIQAVIQNIRQRRPDVVIVGFSINPEDTSTRYGIDSHPIRKLPSATAVKCSDKSQCNSALTETHAHYQGVVSKIKSTVKNIPLIGFAVKALFRLGFLLTNLAEEITFLHASYKRLKTIDVLMITGSNQFLDNFGGAWGFPYTLFKWSILARISNTMVAHVSIGAGPLDRYSSKMLIRGSVALSNYLSFRDVGSKRLTASFLGYKNGKVYPDLAFSLSFAEHIEQNTTVNYKSGIIVGINPMPVYDGRYWHTADELKYREYVRELGNFVVDIVKNGHKVKFFSTHPKDELVSLDIIEYISGAFDVANGDICLADYPNGVFDLMGLVGSFDIVVATRFHGVLLSLLAHKNVIAICYGNKTKELMEEMGQEEFALVLEQITAQKLINCFEKSTTVAEIKINKITETCGQYRMLLDQQYDTILMQ